MKKSLLSILALCTIIPMIVSCGSNKTDSKNDVTTGATTPVVTTPVVTTPEPVVTPTAEYDTWVYEGYEKITQTDRKPDGATTSIDLYMAKNEKEGFHIAIRSTEDVEGLKVNLVSGNRDDISVEMFSEHFIKSIRKYYPDPIVPFDGTFSVASKKNSAILVRFNTEADTEAGTYAYKFNITDPTGAVIGEYNVNLTVWDFALPEYFSTESAVGLSSDYITTHEKLPGRLSKSYHVKYYEMLLDYGLTAYDIPYDILDEKADAYMSDPRVTSFSVPICRWDDEKLLEYYEKIKSNPVWLEKAYFYPYDEPTTQEHMDIVEELCSRLQTLAPEIKIVIPFFKNIKVDNDTDEIDFLEDYVTIWCPKSAAWEEGWLDDPLNRGYFGDRMEEQKAGGDKVWWYVCWEPGPPYNNLYVDEVGLDHVKLFWQQYQFGSDGFLYWGSNYWKYTDDPWTDMATVKWLTNNVFGDGSLLYPGNKVGIEGPVASLRLECIRNGMEDIEMLKLAEELLGKDWVDEKVYKVSQSITDHVKETSVFNAVRKEIGEAVEIALKAD